ncbi:MAG: ribosome small subunit-dependent GTPase A [Limisphaerales bacterium]
MVDLRQLGWDDAWAATLRDPELTPARVVSEGKNYYTVVADDGDHLARAAGRMLHRRRADADLPKVGDWVGVRRVPHDGRVVIETVLPRRTWLARKIPGRETEAQILGTNMDVVFVVQALDATFNLRRLERFLVMVHEGCAGPVVVLNKADLCGDVPARRAEAQAAAGEVTVLTACALTGSGMGDLRKFTGPGRTVAFVGTSGVGKSSLINRLAGEEVQATLEVRESDAKGRHSTTSRELIPLPGGGVVMDTPGMREFHMWTAEEGFGEAFPDIQSLAAGCHFRDCSHVGEKDCAVLAALAGGRLERPRYDSFQKLRRELATTGRRRREHDFQMRKRRAKQGTRAWLDPGLPE